MGDRRRFSASRTKGRAVQAGLYICQNMRTICHATDNFWMGIDLRADGQVVGKSLIAQPLDLVRNTADEATQLLVEISQTKIVIVKLGLVLLKHRYLMIAKCDQR